ncbi:COQ9 family protein [Palleronia caenipelagi]|nr:COQ9 family protein [Palleronia caenipelagi]
MQDPRDKLLDAALMHVAFDGWSDATLGQAARDVGISMPEAKALFPRGGVDMAKAYHLRCDRELSTKVKAADLADLRYSEKVAEVIWLRLDGLDREAVRRGMAVFSLPFYAGEGAKLVWSTADAIWNALGDSSTDGNWYTKRMTLSGVYSSVVLYWLGDSSPGYSATRDFIDRRIGDVMRFQKVKSAVNGNPLGRLMMSGPNFLMSRVQAPVRPPQGFPGAIFGEGENG